jgi:hypothetical protein
MMMNPEGAANFAASSDHSETAGKKAAVSPFELE